MGLLKRMDERARLMGEMMRTVGATEGMPESLSLEASLRRAAGNCLGCTRPQECSQWLEDNAEGAERAPGYCPNADLFADWRRRASRRVPFQI
uniref:DUF6455 family protein n=1 Tax=Stappia sp. TaxID=1870903 RepID=UPI003BA9CAD9